MHNQGAMLAGYEDALSESGILSRFRQFLRHTGRSLDLIGVGEADVNAVIEYFGAAGVNASSPSSGHRAQASDAVMFYPWFYRFEC